MRKIIKPSKIQSSKVHMPSSKSLSHRALITASLAHGDSVIHSLGMNKDTEATIRVMSQAGASFEWKDQDLVVHGIEKIDYQGEVLDCNESGSTIRFLIPVFASQEKPARFTGHGKLMQRPQSVYEQVFHERGLLFEQEGEILTVQGPLTSGTYQVKGNVSSQFLSGLLFTLPLLDGDSVLEVLPPFESSSYVVLTTEALKRSGIEVRQEGNKYYIAGNQTYQPIDCAVEGDDSQLAFYAEESLIQNVPLEILNMNHDSKQGDHVVLELIQRMGAEVKEIEDGYRIVPHTLKGTTIDLADCPDLGPALFCLATQCEGTTTFIHAGRLRVKESDRIACMEEELRKMGCKISSTEDVVTVEGKTPIHGGVTVSGHNDHRIVMALTMLASIADEEVIIEGAEAIQKSYPEFFNDFKKTGGCIYD